MELKITGIGLKPGGVFTPAFRLPFSADRLWPSALVAARLSVRFGVSYLSFHALSLSQYFTSSKK